MQEKCQIFFTVDGWERFIDVYLTLVITTWIFWPSWKKDICLHSWICKYYTVLINFSGKNVTSFFLLLTEKVVSWMLTLIKYCSSRHSWSAVTYFNSLQHFAIRFAKYSSCMLDTFCLKIFFSGYLLLAYHILLLHFLCVPLGSSWNINISVFQLPDFACLLC